MRLFLLLLPFFSLQAVDFDCAIQEMIHTGACLSRQNLCPGFCGGFSRKLDHRIAITAPWRHKGELTWDDFLLVDWNGTPLISGKTCPDDLCLHTCLFRCFDRIGAVLHVHSANALALSRLLAGQSCLVIEGVRIPSFFSDCHSCKIEIPLLDNCQSFSALANDLAKVLKKKKNVFGFLIRGDGLYTWGCDMEEARCRAEFFETLFASELLLRCCN